MAWQLANAAAPSAVSSLHPLRLRPCARLMADLVLITREGCCLCEGLEDKLKALAVPYERLDVDGDPQLKARFDWEVPVLLRREGQMEHVLPRVSPRLSPSQLLAWLKSQGGL